MNRTEALKTLEIVWHSMGIACLASNVLLGMLVFHDILKQDVAVLVEPVYPILFLENLMCYVALAYLITLVYILDKRLRKL